MRRVKAVVRKQASSMMYLLSCAVCAVTMSFLTDLAAVGAEAFPRIGVLLPYASESIQGGLRQGLRELGYIEGRNLIIDWKTAGADYQKLQALADELVRTKADVIVTGGDAASRVVLQMKTSIPVVFISSDPIFAGYAKSLSHPGTNATGMYMPSLELEAKRLELLIEAVPRARRIAYLRNSANPLAPRLDAEMERAAKRLGVELVPVDARAAQDVDSAVARLSKRSADAVIVSTDMILATRNEQIVGALRKAHLPAIYPWRPYLDSGGLMYYGMNHVEAWRRAAAYVDRILKGSKPNDLPVEEISRFELVINLREAGALGIELPQALLMRAEEIVR
jgi:putative tryptophan/tyrosine transport system substrate-binding protein